MIFYDYSTAALRQDLPADGAWQEPIQVLGVGATVRANPGTGGAVTVAYTLSPLAEIVADTATWYTAPAFDGQTVAAEDSVIGRVTAIKAKQVGGSAPGNLEVCQ